MENRFKNDDIMYRGKTIRHLINELLSFDDIDVEVRVSSDCGETSKRIGLVGKLDNCCGLINCENDDIMYRGKTIRHLINELLSFDEIDVEARVSFDCGKTSKSIGLVGDIDNCCVLINYEDD